MILDQVDYSLEDLAAMSQAELLVLDQFSRLVDQGFHIEAAAEPHTWSDSASFELRAAEVA